MGQLWSRAVGGQEDNNQSPIAVAIRENNSQEVHNCLFWNGLLACVQFLFAFSSISSSFAELSIVYLLQHLHLQVGRLLQEGVIEEQEEPLLCLAARFKFCCIKICSIV